MKTFIAYIDNKKVEIQANNKQDARFKLQNKYNVHWSQIII